MFSIGEFDCELSVEAVEAVVEEQPICLCIAVACCLNSAACDNVNCPLLRFSFTWSKNAPNGPQAPLLLFLSSCLRAEFRGPCKTCSGSFGKMHIIYSSFEFGYCL